MIIGLYKNLKIKEEDELELIDTSYECGICCENIDKKDLTTLSCIANKCGCPYYHHDCIVNWWRSIHKGSHLNKKTYVIRQCPYCRVSAKLITPTESTKKLYNKIHSTYKITIDDMISWKCYAITKTSKKQCCNSKNSNYGNYCGIHKKYFFVV